MVRTINMLHNNKEGYAVFTNNDECDNCILTYSKYINAQIIVQAYMKIGFKYIGILREGDLS